ncbi:hypothetical protein IFM89_007687 [Coptis chinensis]|uniref:EF-hand domain-containing protein n=1 Tax=Coptis chinensis TaxID=261450 RepID=A0A835IUN5_9MAGN|nr:hypothetical protein IFM89_007687 [Coptis chinensis]
MGRTPAIILYIGVAILLLFLISHSPKTTSNHPHRRLKLRKNFTFSPTTTAGIDKHHDHIPFDPLIADMERRREDREWEKRHKEIVDAPGAESQPEWEDFMDAEDYLNDEHQFNVTSRLMDLFPKIDVHPADGYITEAELTDWNVRLAQKEVFHRTERDMELHDKNHDGLISFANYEPPAWARNLDNNSLTYDMGWWKEEHFNASDADGDGLLNKTEFNDFLHPADSTNPRLLHWLCKEEVRERDSDKDGKLNFKEFFHGLFDLVRNYDEEVHNSSHEFDNHMEGPAKILFGQLDKDRDGFLSEEELLPIIGKLHPSEQYYAKQQADYIINQVIWILVVEINLHLDQ